MRKTSLSVLLTHTRCVPATGWYAGAPRSRIISAGVRLTNTVGVVNPAPACAPSAAFAAVQLPSSGSFAKLPGSEPAGLHGPSTTGAFSHADSTRRKYVRGVPYSKRSQLVLTANRRSLRSEE